MAHHDDATERIEKKIETKQEAFFNAQALKVLGVVYVTIIPLMTWIVLSIFEIKSEQAILKEKVNSILEMKQDISQIKTDMQQVKVDVAILKSKEESKGK